MLFFLVCFLTIHFYLGGNLELLHTLREAGFDLPDECCDEAARGGHLEILKWARANGCNWDMFTCEYAAQFGHLEVLKWARENGCK